MYMFSSLSRLKLIRGDIVNEKKCAACKELKKVSEFHRNKTVLDGYRNKCKDCRKINSLRG